MPSQGGRYDIRNGERVLVHRTKPASTKPAKAADSTTATASTKTEATAPKPAKAAAKQEVKGNE